VNPKTAKFLAKNGIGLLFTLALGFTYKLNKKVDDKIDDYFSVDEPATDTDQND
jgi:hypothetical protein